MAPSYRALFVQEFNSMFSLLTVLQQMLVQHYSVQRRRINYYTHGIITPPIALHIRRTTRRSAVFSYKFHCYLYWPGVILQHFHSLLRLRANEDHYHKLVVWTQNRFETQSKNFSVFEESLPCEWALRYVCVTYLTVGYLNVLISH